MEYETTDTVYYTHAWRRSASRHGHADKTHQNKTRNSNFRPELQVSDLDIIPRAIVAIQWKQNA